MKKAQAGIERSQPSPKILASEEKVTTTSSLYVFFETIVCFPPPPPSPRVWLYLQVASHSLVGTRCLPPPRWRRLGVSCPVRSFLAVVRGAVVPGVWHFLVDKDYGGRFNELFSACTLLESGNQLLHISSTVLGQGLLHSGV